MSKIVGTMACWRMEDSHTTKICKILTQGKRIMPLHEIASKTGVQVASVAVSLNFLKNKGIVSHFKRTCKRKNGASTGGWAMTHSKAAHARLFPGYNESEIRRAEMILLEKELHKMQRHGEIIRHRNGNWELTKRMKKRLKLDY